MTDAQVTYLNGLSIDSDINDFKKGHGFSYHNPDFQEAFTIKLRELGILDKYETYLEQYDREHGEILKPIAKQITAKIASCAETIQAVPIQSQGAANSKGFDIKLVQGRELQTRNLPDVTYAVSGLIPEGYTIFSGAFKMGKSWLVQEMGLAVASGGDFLGLPTTKGVVVYMALEDCEKFAQERLKMLLGDKEAPESFYYIYDGVPSLDDGFIDYLDQLYERLPDIRLLIVDVLAKIEYQQKGKETQYHCDYRTGTALKKWADSKGISLLAVTHTTKMAHPDDPFMNTTGTNGVTGSADAILTIYKKDRADKNGILAVTGRRVREKYMNVHLDDNCIWVYDGDADESILSQDPKKQSRDDELSEYLNSKIRSAVIELSKKHTSEAIRARGVIDKAAELGIYLLESAQDVGLFLYRFQNHFMVKDKIRVSIIKNGSGSKLYRFEQIEDNTEPIPFD